MRVIVIEPPAPVVDFEEAVARLRPDDADERADVEAMIAAATAHLDGPDGWLGRCLGEQTIEARFDAFDAVCQNGSIFLPYRPVLEILSISYVDETGSIRTLDATAYELIGHEIIPAYRTAWPVPRDQREAVRIRFRAGYETVPAPIRAAILLMVGDLYQNRETTASGSGTSVASIPMAASVENLLAPFRVFR